MKKCSVNNRQRSVAVRGMCRSHDRRNGLDTFIRVKKYDVECAVDGCSSISENLAYCGKHYRAFKRHGDPCIQHRSSGNIVPNKDGYMVVGSKHPSNPYPYRVYQHRLVMESIIGRPLLDHESVHHKNGDRADNRPENLELWSKKQPAGQRVEDKLKWAYEIISLYGKKFSV